MLLIHSTGVIITSEMVLSFSFISFLSSVNSPFFCICLCFLFLMLDSWIRVVLQIINVCLRYLTHLDHILQFWLFFMFVFWYFVFSLWLSLWGDFQQMKCVHYHFSYFCGNFIWIYSVSLNLFCAFVVFTHFFHYLHPVLSFLVSEFFPMWSDGVLILYWFLYHFLSSRTFIFTFASLLFTTQSSKMPTPSF